jgi:Zn-dependent peptidase ImmA (M78 family)
VPITAPTYSEPDLRGFAAEFLAEHHPDGSIPVPIDRIAERPPFSLDIVPVPGLQDNFDTVAYLTSDLTEIRIDEHVFHSRQRRYRFSLAHEIGHKIMHAGVFEQLSFSTISEWKDARNLIPEREYRFIEWHANCFAGLVLVPPAPLKRAFEASQEYLTTIDMSIHDATPAVWDTIESWIADKFDVSREVIARRGPADDLWEA